GANDPSRYGQVHRGSYSTVPAGSRHSGDHRMSEPQLAVRCFRGHKITLLLYVIDQSFNLFLRVDTFYQTQIDRRRSLGRDDGASFRANVFAAQPVDVQRGLVDQLSQRPAGAFG